MNASPLAAPTCRILPCLLTAAVFLAVLAVCLPVDAASVRFLPLSQEIAERKVGLQDGKTITILGDLNLRKRTKAYTCKVGTNPISIVALDRERPHGKPMGVELLLTAEMKSPLVLILASPDEPSGMRAIVIEDDSNTFGWGSLRFLNTTEKPLMLRFEKETKAISEELKPFDIVPGGDARNIGVQLFSEEKPDAILYSAVWEHDPNLRKLVLILPETDPARKELKLEIIPQDQRVKD